MRMKNDETLPTFNLQVGTQNGFVTLHNIVYRYIKSYNELRPHQGIANAHPSADAPLKEGRIKDVLFFLDCISITTVMPLEIMD